MKAIQVLKKWASNGKTPCVEIEDMGKNQALISLKDKKRMLLVLVKNNKAIMMAPCRPHK